MLGMKKNNVQVTKNYVDKNHQDMIQKYGQTKNLDKNMIYMLSTLDPDIQQKINGL